MASSWFLILNVQNKNNRLSILIVDDDADIRYAIARILKRCECDVIEAGSVSAAFEQLKRTAVDIVFSDMRFNGHLGGKEILNHATQNYPHIDVVLISSAMDGAQQTELKALGAADCLQKPLFRETCLTLLGNLGQNQQKAV